MNVHQILSGAGPHDAITAIARAMRARFADWGWGGRDFAARLSPGLNGAVSLMPALKPDPEDVLLLHHSAYMPGLSDLLERPQPKLLLYHNITPAETLWDQAPVIATFCAAGRAQLQDLAPAVDVAAGVSGFNAAELAAAGACSPRVIPPLVDPRRLGEARDDAAATGLREDPTVLFVGRLSPHKRQDSIIRAFALLRRVHLPAARLVLIGSPVTVAYEQHLRDLAQAQAPGAVRIESGLSDTELGERYRQADAFLCLSEHEGFCLPLLEAFRHGVPVVARPAGAVPEVSGDAALLCEDEDLAVVAELLHLALTDAPLRAELVRRGRRRVEQYAPAQVEPLLRQAVEQAAAGHPASCAPTAGAM